jgi:hypothetical protein
MPSEWLPAGLAGSSKKPGFAQQVRMQMDNTLGQARENASNVGAASGVLPAADTCCPSLTFRERVYGCLGCLALGFLISFLSFLSWWSARRATAAPPPHNRRAPHAAPASVRRPARRRAGGHTAQFAVLYTFGNIVSIAGSGFLLGPKRQCRNMSRARRRWATAIYLSMMVLTLFLAFTHAPRPPNTDAPRASRPARGRLAHAPLPRPLAPSPRSGAPPILVLFTVFLQWCALVWYIASYIPFGQKIITKIFKKVTNF